MLLRRNNKRSALDGINYLLSIHSLEIIEIRMKAVVDLRLSLICLKARNIRELLFCLLEKDISIWCLCIHACSLLRTVTLVSTLCSSTTLTKTILRSLVVFKIFKSSPGTCWACQWRWTHLGGCCGRTVRRPGSRSTRWFPCQGRGGWRSPSGPSSLICRLLFSMLCCKYKDNSYTFQKRTHWFIYMMYTMKQNMTLLAMRRSRIGR